MIDHKHYAYRVIWSQDDEEYVGLCAEFPSLSFLAPEQTTALEGITETVGEVLTDMLASGEELPEPLSAGTYSGKFQVRIAPEQHRSLAIEAKEQGISMNKLVSVKLA